MAKSNIKIFVLDTNVLLHDYKCIYNFQDNDIVIPIVALEELDKFKKGNDTLNFNARECTRELDELIGKADPVKGIAIGKGHGKLYLALGQKYPDSMKVSFPEPTADHRILAIAEKVSKDNPGRKVVVVSKDINLRVKAKSLGIAAEDYTTDKVQNI
ncbi:MAG: ribonuclease, partial [Salinivirgaceae bacterium]|nr:ribonuclease [Salinivirgaceae bacterium]